MVPICALLVLGVSGGSDEPMPDRNGILTLAATQAELDGERLRLRGPESGTYVAGWTTERERVRWSFEVPTAGRYQVVIEYVAPLGRQGASFEVEVAGQTRGATIQATGAADRFLPQPLKEPVDLEAGRQVLEVRATDVPRGFVMNLSRVRLVPAGGGEKVFDSVGP